MSGLGGTTVFRLLGLGLGLGPGLGPGPGPSSPMIGGRLDLSYGSLLFVGWPTLLSCGLFPPFASCRGDVPLLVPGGTLLAVCPPA